MFPLVIIGEIGQIFSGPPISPPIYFTCKIVSPPLLPLKFRPPFRIKMRFKVESDCLNDRAREFSFESKWKNTEYSFVKTWQTNLYFSSLGKNCFLRFSKINYRVIDSRGRMLMDYDEPHSPLKVVTKPVREAVLMITPEFKADGSSKVDHEVVLVEVPQ